MGKELELNRIGIFQNDNDGRREEQGVNICKGVIITTAHRI